MNAEIQQQIQHLQRLLAAQASPQGKLTVGDAVEQYMKDRPLKPHTVKTYRQCFAPVFGHLSGTPLNEVTREQIVNGFRAAPGQQVGNLAVCLLRATYNALEVTPPLKRWPRHILRPRDRVIQREKLPEFWAAVRQMNPLTQLAATFCLGYGLRRSEVASLQWADFKSDSFLVRNTKNGRDLELPITPKLRAALPEARGTHVCPRGFKKHAVVKLRRALGLEFSAHDLRRSFITIACELGVNAYMVKALANHAADDVTSTHYFRPSLAAKLAALEQIQQVVL